MTSVDHSGTAAPGAVADTWTPALTPRQEQILSLISAGMTNREIGAELGVAEKTVKNCVTGLLASLGLQRRSQAAVYGAMRRMTTAH
jgi:DNA-binding NarL/FixJ family response regulator